MCGGETAWEAFPRHVYKIDAENVISFAVTRNMTLLLKKMTEKPKPSIIPDLPEETGLIHFYRESGQWKFISQTAYESKKVLLPAISFATKVPIEDFKKKEFPDLQELSQRADRTENY